MLEVVQQFREFKPYLKKRLQYIIKSGRDLELRDEVQDINFFLHVMTDILADETHGVDQLRSYIDKIHEMIRKNPTPITDLQGNLSSLDATDNLNDNDHPRSPSPEARGEEDPSNCRVIPTHGGHRTVEVSFTSRKDHSKSAKEPEDEWGSRNVDNSFTRREHYKDVDMRQGSFYDGAGSSFGRGQRRWSGESDFSGARGMGRGHTGGRDGPSMSRRSDDYRRDRDSRSGHGRGYDNDKYEDDWFRTDRTRDRTLLKNEKESEPFTLPSWLTGAPSNGNAYDEWASRHDNRDTGFRSNFERRPPREHDEWNGGGGGRGRGEFRDDRHHRQPQHHQSQSYERRPSTETRREERNEELLYERRPRNDRPHESSSRQDVNRSPVEYNHGPSHSHTRRREDEDNMHMRGRMDGHYPPHAASPNMMSPNMTSIHMPHPPPGAMGYNVGQPQHQNLHYTNTSVMAPPPTHYPGVSSPLLPLPVPNAPNPRMNLPIPNVPPPMAANVSHPMSFQSPPVNNFVRPEMHGSPASFTHVPPPQTSRPPPTPHHHTTEAFHGGSPGYASPVESADRVREISMLKAKQCFGRTVSRPPPPGAPPQASPPTPSTVTSVPSGPLSPKTFESSTNKGVLDPRLNRASRPQARQQSPPAAPPPSPKLPQPPARPDAGNVLRADPRKSQGRARGSIDEGRRKLMETRDRVRDQEASRKSHHNKVSKIQELRKQLEKEGLHRLGRPAPKKPVGSFEDAIGYDNDPDALNKPNEKSKSRSPSKEKDSDDRHHGRSHSDKTDRDRSPKKTDEKNKSKDKSHAKDGDSEKKKDKSGKKKSERGKKSPGKAGSGKGSKKKAASDNQDKGSENQEKNKLAGFKIPRKPKPVPPPEPEVPVIDPIPEPTASTSEKSGHEVSTSPPASPEPALTQVPDVENRTDDAEPSTSSTKPTTPAAPAASTTDEINPDALEFLKQFLITTMQPEEREHILGNQENLTSFFYKIKSEIVAAKEKHEDTTTVPQVTPGEADSDKSVVEVEMEDGKERGRCREKRKNSKRRSSLEKLHDALKEMRFDTMLPLGPRRCTRGGQEEAAAAGENAETTEPLLPPPIVEPSTSTSVTTIEQQEDSDSPKTANKKRGRPPIVKKAPIKKVVKKVAKKVVPKKKRQSSPPPPPPPPVPASPEQEQVADEEDAEIDDSVSQVSAPPVGRGRKRKLKPTKPSPNKRAKKSGPVTRAQAALKNAKELKLKPVLPPPPPPPAKKKWDLEKVGKATKTTKRMARRLTRNKQSKMGDLDTAVNIGLGKIKIEADFISPSKMKPEPQEVESLLNTSGVALDDDDLHIDGIYLADQLDNIINENLDCDTVINMDRQTEENMDLDVFNTLDADESEISTAKNDLNMSIDDEPYFQGTLVGRSLSPSDVAAPSNSNLQSAPNVIPGNGVGIVSIASKSVHADKRSQLPTTTLALSSTINLSGKLGNGGLELSSNMSSSSTTSFPTVGETVGLQISHSMQEKPLASNYTPLNHDEPARTPSSTSLTTESTELEGKKENTIPSVESSRSASPATTMSSVGNVVDTSEDSNQSTSVKMKLDVSNLKSDSDDDLRKGVFKCEACNYTGKKIIAHYVNKHPLGNIPQARLMPETFNGLIELNTSQSPQLLEIILDEEQTQVWPCLYCDDRYDCVSAFFDHLTSHTGEFRFECTECGTAYPYQKSITNHAKSHKGVSKNCVKILFESGVEKGSKELSGFLCNDCYYFQLRFESIIRHIEQTGHSSLDVKSVRLIRPSANSGVADSNPSVVLPLTNEVPEKLAELSSQPAQSQSGVENTEPSQTIAPLEPVNEKENECVFFGTNVNFTPPSITLNECSLAIPPVFAEPFLDGLLKKVHVDDEDTPSQLQQNEEASQVRKRKRVDSEIENQSDQTNTTTAEIPTAEEKSEGEVAKPATSRPKTIHNFYPNRANSERIFWNALTERCTEEPNDFFVSSDESSDDSDEEDSEVVSDSDGSTSATKPAAKRLRTELQKDSPAAKAEAMKTEFPEGMRNNEHLVKLKVMPELELEKSYVKSRDVIPIRRAGDLFNPNTVLFGYIMPSVIKNSPKLRDSKEVDKLSHITGRRGFPVKNRDTYNEMLAIPKLMHLFKCMGTYCTYTTDCAADFYNHLHAKHFRSHEIRHSGNSCSRAVAWQDMKLAKDAECCSYCSARYKHTQDIIDHIVNQHGQSAFQCSKCFYRSFYHRYVVRHFDIAHPNETVQVLKCGKKQLIQSQEATLFQIFVYKCDIDNPKCDKSRRFVFREDFLEHLHRCIPVSNMYPCHLCKVTVPLEELIEHYKLHNLFKFHCSYCQFGSEVKSDLDEHFVLVHPNTSGRVFYRVKPAPSCPGQPHIKPENMSRVITELPEPIELDESSNSAGGMPSGENQAGADGGPMDISENEDSEKGRVTNLKGRDLYRCVTGECDFSSDDSDSFKAHVTACSLVAESRSLACAHCERKMKTVTNLLEHMKVHGEKKQICSLCPFRSWTSTEVTKHVKTVHRVMNYKLIKKELSEGSDPDVVAFAKDVAAKMCTAETFANNYYLFTRKALYSFDNIDKLPQSKVFSSDLYCALCPYSSKVRSNIVRHLTIHKKSLEDGVTVVPQAPRINPVPYLSRESLEFDKMMNLAASSHKTDGGTAKGDEVRKLPQFVKEQFRYVCSVCDHMTSDEGLLQTHIKVIHSEVNIYRCPHCQKNPGTKDNPEYIVTLDKIAHHLRLHGPKLFKCGHCMMVQHQVRAMEKHIPEKHPEKKPIHYLIRDVDPDGIPSSRPSTSAGFRRHSSDDSKGILAEKWKCFLCSSKSIFGAWEEIKAHCESVHKVNSQFMCLVCDFSSDDVSEMLTHCQEKCTSIELNKILVMFSKCETFDEDSTSTMPMWKKHGGAVRHIHGNFTEDSVALIRQYNNQLNAESNSLTNSPLKASTSAVPAKPVAKPSSATSKARRSTGGTTPTKFNVAKAILTMPLPPSPPKMEVFKYHCHKCDMYKTKNPNELRIHLFNEFRYKRWKCLVCNLTFTTEKSLKGHIERDHQKVYHPDLYYLQPPNPEIEIEIDDCIERQNRKKDLINSFAIEKLGKLSCKHCKEDGLTYSTFETHILQKHSG
ncbi:unnamed protein product [Orchesella dallaii]